MLTLASLGDAAGLKALWLEEEQLRRRGRGQRGGGAGGGGGGGGVVGSATLVGAGAGAGAAALDVNAHAPDGDAALHLAAVVGGARGAECVELLVEQFGCCVDERDASGCTALMFAVSARQEAVVRYLCLSTDASVDAADEQGRTALHVAALSVHSDLLTLLLRTRCAVDVQDEDGNTPLLLALLEQRKEDRAAAPHFGHTSASPSSSAYRSRALSRSLGHSRTASADVDEAAPAAVLPAYQSPLCTPPRGRLSLSASSSSPPLPLRPTRSSAAPSAPPSPSSMSTSPTSTSSSSHSRAAPLSPVSAGREDVLVRLLQAGADLCHTNRVGESGWALAAAVGLLDLCVTAIRKRERDRSREVERALHEVAIQHSWHSPQADIAAERAATPPSLPSSAPPLPLPLPRLPLGVLELIRAYDSHQLIQLPAPLDDQPSLLLPRSAPQTADAASPAVSSASAAISSLTSLAAQATATVRRGSFAGHRQQPPALTTHAASSASRRLPHRRLSSTSSSKYQRVATNDEALQPQQPRPTAAAALRALRHSRDRDGGGGGGAHRGRHSDGDEGEDEAGAEEEEGDPSALEPLEGDTSASPSPDSALAHQARFGHGEEEEEGEEATMSREQETADNVLQLTSLTLSIDRTSSS